MTITRPDQASPSRSTRTEWTIVQRGLWVGKTNGEFAGMIEAGPDGYSATTRLAKYLGVFPTVDEAKASFSSL